MILTTTADGGRAALVRDTRHTVLEAGVPTWFCRRSRPLVLKNSWQLARRALRLASDAGVIHVHGVYLAHSFWAYLASRRTGTPYVLQPHGALEPYQEQRSRARKRVFHALTGRRIVAGASVLVATSDPEAMHLRARFPTTRVDVVPLGFTPARPTEIARGTGRDDALSAIAARPRGELVAFVGRLARKKRPELLVDAWSRVTTRALLVLAGPEEDWTYDELIDRLPPQRRDSVVCLGELSPGEVAWVLSRSGIFVLPSDNENFGLTVVEAMSHGCAVLTTEQTAASAHVVAAGSGVVLPAPDLDLLIESLDKLLIDPAIVAELGARGSAYARTHLTWQHTASSLQTLYREVRATAVATAIPLPRPPQL
jgi:glycosyltransferase involved in cell wall biosynthesis